MNYADLRALQQRRRPASGLKPLPYDPEAGITRPLDVLAPTTGTYGEAASRMVPLAGEAWAVDDARKALSQGDRLGAALSVGLGMLPFGGTLAALKSGKNAFRSGATTLKMGGKTAVREPGAIPNSVDVQGFHWSPEGNLYETDPRMYGRGIKGAEADRLADHKDIRPRTYFYTNEMRKEPGLGANQYTTTLKGVYPASDPMGIWKRFGDDLTGAERAIKEAGFKGYEGSGEAAVYFDPVRVARHTQGQAPAPAPLATPKLTDATEVQVGSQLGTSPLPPELEAERMNWLANSNRAYQKLGLNPESANLMGSYLNPQGVLERNKFLATDIPHSPRAESAVDLVSAARNIMLGQNARGGVGVSPSFTGQNAVRMNVGPADLPRLEGMIPESEAKGVFTVKTPQGLSFVGDSMEQDALKQHVHDLALRHGLTDPSIYEGGQIGLYHEFPWAQSEGRYQPGTGKVTMEELMPRIEANPALTKDLDATWGLQELAKGIRATEAKAMDLRNPIQTLPEDVMKLNALIERGGLSAVQDYVRRYGPAGLPAGFGFMPYQDER